MSTKPGVTSRPSASMTRVASPVTGPTTTMTPSFTATSAVRAGAPVPSMTVPLRTIRSNSWLAMGRSLLQCGQDLAGDEPLGHPHVVGVGTEGRPGDDEPFQAERGQFGDALGAPVGR